MSKRPRVAKDQLTGGTGDVSPQLISGIVTQSGVDTTTSAQIALPINRIPGTGGAVTIIELLKIYGNFSNFTNTAAGETSSTQTAFFTTQNFGATATTLQDPATIVVLAEERRGAFTATGSYFTLNDGMRVQDLTDGAGHGVLIATDNMFVQLVTAGTGGTNSLGFKILYRFKKVSLVEYIGIVQSQQ